MAIYKIIEVKILDRIGYKFIQYETYCFRSCKKINKLTNFQNEEILKKGQKHWSIEYWWRNEHKEDQRRPDILKRTVEVKI